MVDPHDLTIALLALTLLASLVITIDARRRIRHLWAAAHLDPLTGLANRRLFMREFSKAFQRADRSPFSVAVIDLDDFKTINDTFGHVVGDDILRHVAAILRTIPEPAMVGRLGGDEFAVIIPGSHRAGRLIAEAIPVELAGIHVPGFPQHQVLASVGVAFCRTAHAPADLLRMADDAMYHAKRHQLGSAPADAGTPTAPPGQPLDRRHRDR